MKLTRYSRVILWLTVLLIPALPGFGQPLNTDDFRVRNNVERHLDSVRKVNDIPNLTGSNDDPHVRSYELTRDDNDIDYDVWDQSEEARLLAKLGKPLYDYSNSVNVRQLFSEFAISLPLALWGTVKSPDNGTTLGCVSSRPRNRWQGSIELGRKDDSSDEDEDDDDDEDG